MKNTRKQAPPELTPAVVLAIAAGLQAKGRARLTNLSAAGRLRKWGAS